VATLIALNRRLVPPTLGLTDPDDDLDLDYVPGEPRRLPDASECERLVGLSNSFGFGGHNATVALASGAPPL
jgi:3-oxoacyl-[acyl-carrier-protein] synthase II